MPSWNAALPSVLAGSSLPARLESLRTPLLATVEDLAGEMVRFYRAAPLPQHQLLADSSQTLAIMGVRGSGKSTLLSAVCGRLINEGRHLVLPIIRPELFSETDSVLAAFLAELWELMSPDIADLPDVDEAPVSPDPALRVLAETSRTFAISRTTIATLESASDSPIAFGDDVITVTRSGVTLVRRLRELARALCFASEAATRLIIVPVDDPDLTRRGINQLLTELQFLGAIPGIVPITGFSPSDIRDAWLSERAQLTNRMRDEDLEFAFARQLEKIFPYRYRFEIEPVPQQSRATFTPLGHDRALGTLLESFCRQVSESSGTEWDFHNILNVDLSDIGLPSPLPDNPRTLVQLWDVLEFAQQASADRDSTHLTLRRMLDILAEPIAGRLGLTSREFAEVGLPSARDRKRPLTLRNREIQLVVAARGDFSDPPEPSVARIQMRELASVRAVRTPSGRESQSDFRGVEVASLLALQDIGFGSGMFNVTNVPDSLGMNQWLFLQRVEMAGQSTDNLFITIPVATTLTEVAWAARQWNHLVQISSELTSVGVLATSVAAACASATGASTPVAPTDNYHAAFRKARRTFASCGSSNRADAFRSWFSRELPMHWHTAFFTSQDIRQFANLHRETCESRPGGEVERDVLNFRVKNVLDEIESGTERERNEARAKYSWIAGYFELASALNSPHVEELSRLYPSWQRAAAGVKVGAAAAGHVVRSKARRKMAPHATPESTELLAAGIAALKRATVSARRTVRGRA